MPTRTGSSSIVLRLFARGVFALSLTLSTGCASASSTTAGSTTPSAVRTLVTSDQIHLVTPTDVSDRSIYDAPADRVFLMAVAAMTELGVDPTVIEPPKYHAAALGVPRRRVLAKTPLSRYFNCGSDVTGARADSDRLTVTVDATVEALSPKTSELRLLVSATSRAVSGSSSDAVYCGSLGTLEKKMRGEITQRLSSP